MSPFPSKHRCDANLGTAAANVNIPHTSRHASHSTCLSHHPSHYTPQTIPRTSPLTSRLSRPLSLHTSLFTHLTSHRIHHTLIPITTHCLHYIIFTILLFPSSTGAHITQHFFFTHIPISCINHTIFTSSYPSPFPPYTTPSYYHFLAPHLHVDKFKHGFQGRAASPLGPCKYIILDHLRSSVRKIYLSKNVGLSISPC